MDTKVKERLEELLEAMGETEMGTKEYDALVKEYLILSKASTDAFKAESENTNNNDRNKVEKAKALYEMISRLGTGVIGALVTLRLTKVIGSVEEFGAVTTKILGFIPKWKF